MNTKPVLGKMKPRRVLYATLLLILLLSLGFAVPAFTQGLEDDNVFTGCVNQNSGAIRNIAVGYEPVKPCNDEEFKITWDHAKPEFESRIAALEERVAELEEPFGTLDLFVDCGAGDTVSAALEDAQTHAGPVNITISGICDEQIDIHRDDVSISGLLPTDGIRGPSTGGGGTVQLTFAHRVSFSNMTISGGWEGMSALGSSFEVSYVTIQDARWTGIMALDGSVGEFRNCSVSGHSDAGVTAGAESVVDIDHCSISNNGTGVWISYDGGGGTIFVRDSEIVDNDGYGAFVIVGGNLALSNTLIANNLNGGVLSGGGQLNINGDTHITGNSYGVHVAHGSSASISNDVIIESNHGDGISVSGGSALRVFDAIIRYNEGNGISIKDLSTVTMWMASPVISSNNGWGVSCDGPAAIAVLGGQGLFDPSEVLFSGNILGHTNCQ